MEGFIQNAHENKRDKNLILVKFAARPECI